MSLESKAKSYEEIYALWRKAWKKTVDGVHNPLLDQKWVRLEDAQKEVTKHNLEWKEKVLKVNNWFERIHNEIYKKHKEADGLIAKFLEAHMGAIDQAWCNFRLIFQDELKEA